MANLAKWVGASGPEIQQAWLGRAHPIGTKLEIHSAHAEKTGSFAGLSPAGELLLQTKDGIATISTGDVMLGLA